MPRNISFSMTTQQIYRREKTVTRRIGWAFLKPGDVLQAVEKAQGLKKGEKVKRICKIVVESTRWEPLNAITQSDCISEGFPDMTPNDFVEMFCRVNRWEPDKDVNRIEFRYIEDQHVYNSQ